MSTTAPIFSNPAYTNAANPAQPTATKKTLDQQDFLNLLITQLKNQDPLNPMKDTEFIAQMASFSSLQQATQMNTNIQKLLDSQQQLNSSTAQQQNSSTAVSMIGKQITDVNGVSGLVSSVKIADNGTVSLVVNDKEISLSDVRAVRNTTI